MMVAARGPVGPTADHPSDGVTPMMWFFAILIVLAMGGVAVVAAGRGAPDGRRRTTTGPTPACPPTARSTRDDLRARAVPTALRGYRMSEVDALLDRLATELEARRGPTTPTSTAATRLSDGDADTRANCPTCRPIDRLHPHGPRGRGVVLTRLRLGSETSGPAGSISRPTAWSTPTPSPASLALVALAGCSSSPTRTRSLGGPWSASSRSPSGGSPPSAAC